MRYLEPDEVLVLHALVVDETGGRHGVRDVGMLQSSCHRPRTAVGGKEMFPDIFEKAAVYLESFVKFHVFVDGNKRTAITTTARFLWLNGYSLEASQKDIVLFVLRVAEERLTLHDIAAWISQHVRALAR